MTSIETSAAAPPPEEGAKMGFFARLFGIYFEPKKTFGDVDRKGSWLGILVLESLVFMGAAYALTTRMDHETYMRKTFERSPFTKNMPAERKEEMIARSGSFQRYSPMIFAPVGVLIGYLVIATALMVIFILMGVSIKFKKSLAVTAWGIGPPAVLLMLLATVFILVRDPDTLDIFNLPNNVASNPSMAVSDQEHPVLHSLLGSIDIFSAWTICLLAIGYSTVSRGRLTAGKAAVGILIAWAIYVAGKLGVTAVFS